MTRQARGAQTSLRSWFRRTSPTPVAEHSEPGLLGRLVDCSIAGSYYFRVMRNAYYLGVVGIAIALVASTAPAEAATFHVKVTCTVPKSQPQRQLAPNSCLNFVPDGTQTFAVRVTDSNGRAVSGASVQWTDSATNAQFRVSKNPCTTATNGRCSDELVVTRPRAGQMIQVTATFGGSAGVGFLTFQ